jgi:aspartate aminotransferase
MFLNSAVSSVINQNLFGLSVSATVAINEKSNALLKSGKKVYRFGFGQSPFPVPDIVVKALQENAFQKDYLPVRGLPELRAAIAGFINRRKGTSADAGDVLIGPGSKELMFLLQLSYYGELVIPAPCWVSYAPQAQIIGRHIMRVPTRTANNLLLMPDELEAICSADPERPRLLILNYPANPTGTAYDEPTLQALAEVARKYGITVLSDEIYAELNHQGRGHSIAEYYPEGTIISGGLSKWCGAGGWRLGFFVFPKSMKRLEEAMAVCASETFTSTSAPIQYAAVKAFEESPEIDAYLVAARAVLAAVGHYIHSRLSDMGVYMPRPDGGFYLFPDFEPFREGLLHKGLRTDRDMCEALLHESGVALLPGAEFGIRPDRYTARLSYVDFDGKAALAAAETYLADNRVLDDRFVEAVCPNIAEGTGAIIRWFENLQPRRPNGAG